MIAHHEGAFLAGECRRGRSTDTILDTPAAERTPSPMLPDRQLESHEVVKSPIGPTSITSAPGLPSSATPLSESAGLTPPPQPVSAPEPGNSKEARDKVYFRNLGETMPIQYMCGMFILWHLNS